MENNTPAEDYVPYGPEWKTEMHKLPKPILIDMIHKEGLRRQAANLDKKERELIAFALFGLGIRIGPESFNLIESIVQKLDLTEEFAHYAHGWISFNEKKGTG